jgi:uncharacterized protein (TIGR03086 family)
MDEVVGRFQASVNCVDTPLHAMAGTEWSQPTPCSDWDVRALLLHVVNELSWVPPLLAGRTVADVGSELDGDLLGADPVGAFHHAARLAHTAFEEPGAVDRVVHLSYGDESAANYCGQLTADMLIHGWDLARGVGADDTLPDGLVIWATGWLESVAPMLAGTGMFAPPLAVEPGADAQTALLAALGRAR